jgi:hypothetical protein
MLLRVDSRNVREMIMLIVILQKQVLHIDIQYLLCITGSPPSIVSTPTKVRMSPINQNVVEKRNQSTEPKSVFTFDGLAAEGYLTHPDNSRVPSRLTNSSLEGDASSDVYDSDYKSCVVNSYIEGVSLNSRWVIEIKGSFSTQAYSNVT